MVAADGAGAGARIELERGLVRQVDLDAARPGREVPRAPVAVVQRVADAGLSQAERARPPPGSAPACGPGAQRRPEPLDTDRPGPGPDVYIAADGDNLHAAGNRLDRRVSAKDSDRYNFANWRDAPTCDSRALAHERGNVVSVTVPTVRHARAAGPCPRRDRAGHALDPDVAGPGSRAATGASVAARLRRHEEAYLDRHRSGPAHHTGGRDVLS